MKLELPAITDDDRKKYRSYTDGAIQGIKLIESMPHDQLRRLITGRDNMVRRAVMNAMGTNTNPSWITARAAEVLYRFGSLSEEEFDRITE